MQVLLKLMYHKVIPTQPIDWEEDKANLDSRKRETDIRPHQRSDKVTKNIHAGEEEQRLSLMIIGRTCYDLAYNHRPVVGYTAMGMSLNLSGSVSPHKNKMQLRGCKIVYTIMCLLIHGKQFVNMLSFGILPYNSQCWSS